MLATKALIISCMIFMISPLPKQATYHGIKHRFYHVERRLKDVKILIHNQFQRFHLVIYQFYSRNGIDVSISTPLT